MPLLPIIASQLTAAARFYCAVRPLRHPATDAAASRSGHFRRATLAAPSVRELPASPTPPIAGETVRGRLGGCALNANSFRSRRASVPGDRPHEDGAPGSVHALSRSGTDLTAQRHAHTPLHPSQRTYYYLPSRSHLAPLYYSLPPRLARGRACGLIMPAHHRARCQRN